MNSATEVHCRYRFSEIIEQFDGVNKELDASSGEQITDVNQNQSKKQLEEDKLRRLLKFDEVPAYLAHNKFILSGYRGLLTTKLCLESMFWWTNETINIWSHMFGFFLFSVLIVYDIFALDADASSTDKPIIAQVLICFMVCMICSGVYHTFSCRSERDFHCFLTFDLIGVASGLLAIFISGIYFIFWCHPGLTQFYISSVPIIFLIAMAIQLPRFQVDSIIKMLMFIVCTAYSAATIHWIFEMGGLKHPDVFFSEIIELFDGVNKELDASSGEHITDVNQNQSKKQFEEDKLRRLLKIEEVPAYLAHNKFILSGYRGLLTTKLCLESMFWWTNETINIWSHVFGFFLFSVLIAYDIFALDVDATSTDKPIIAQVLICFMVCMMSSALYHTFSCRSERDFHCFLTFDLIGVAMGLFAIFISGIYFIFWCHPGWRQFYISTVTIIFLIAMAMQLPRFQVDSNIKMLMFVVWTAYGIIPTIHWTFKMGGFRHPDVLLLLPKIAGMYVLCGTAFLIYVTKIPERFAAGKFDFLGHSHQWWHFFIVAAFYYWYCSGMVYANYRKNHTCSDSMHIDFY